MFENPYNQNLQDQLGQLSRMLGGQQPVMETPAANRFDSVDGIEGARAFLQKMLPSTKHIVWDSGKAAFYVLQKDANGTAQRIQIGTFTIEPEPTMEERYVTREDFAALTAKIDQLLNKEVTNG